MPQAIANLRRIACKHAIDFRINFLTSCAPACEAKGSRVSSRRHSGRCRYLSRLNAANGSSSKCLRPFGPLWRGGGTSPLRNREDHAFSSNVRAVGDFCSVQKRLQSRSPADVDAGSIDLRAILRRWRETPRLDAQIFRLIRPRS